MGQTLEKEANNEKDRCALSIRKVRHIQPARPCVCVNSTDRFEAMHSIYHSTAKFADIGGTIVHLSPLRN